VGLCCQRSICLEINFSNINLIENFDRLFIVPVTQQRTGGRHPDRDRAAAGGGFIA
jgi:hypothetical protein